MCTEGSQVATCDNSMGIEEGTGGPVDTITVPSEEDDERMEIKRTFSPSLLRERNRHPIHNSDIETLARTLDDRRKHRIQITFAQRKKFLDICLEECKKERNRSSLSKFSKESLERLVTEYRKKVEQRNKTSGSFDKMLPICGCWDTDRTLLKLFECGLLYTREVNETEFYFRDFCFYNTVLASKFALMRYASSIVVFSLFIFYVGSAIFFCEIMRNENVCPRESGGRYQGWVTAIYFASITMSTVGYGDVSLFEEGQTQWATFGAIAYMLVSMAIAFTVFTSVARMAFDGIFSFGLLDRFKHESKDIPLYRQVRRLVSLRVIELTFYFLLLNSIGALASYGFVNWSDKSDQSWNWMTAAYWSVQTLTTIGYGDLDMPVNLRWFNIFFSTFGTAFVGSVFGSLAGLRDELEDHRRFHAWWRRDPSKVMIHELQVDDEKLDMNEFVLGSLLVLGKVKTKDIDQIMDKFRDLAKGKQYISMQMLSANQREVEIDEA